MVMDVVVVKNFQSLMGSHENWVVKILVANGCGRVKFTTLVARVSLVYHNARPPVM